MSSQHTRWHTYIQIIDIKYEFFKLFVQSVKKQNNIHCIKVITWQFNIIQNILSRHRFLNISKLGYLEISFTRSSIRIMLYRIEFNECYLLLCISLTWTIAILFADLISWCWLHSNRLMCLSSCSWYLVCIVSYYRFWRTITAPST